MKRKELLILFIASFRNPRLLVLPLWAIVSLEWICL